MQVAAAIEISVAASQEVKRTALKAIALKKILSLWHQLTLARFHLDTRERGGSPLAELWNQLLLPIRGFKLLTIGSSKTENVVGCLKWIFDS